MLCPQAHNLLLLCHHSQNHAGSGSVPRLASIQKCDSWPTSSGRSYSVFSWKLASCKLATLQDVSGSVLNDVWEEQPSAWHRSTRSVSLLPGGQSMATQLSSTSTHAAPQKTCKIPLNKKHTVCMCCWFAPSCAAYLVYQTHLPFRSKLFFHRKGCAWWQLRNRAWTLRQNLVPFEGRMPCRFFLCPNPKPWARRWLVFAKAWVHLWKAGKVSDVGSISLQVTKTVKKNTHFVCLWRLQW